MMPSNVYCVQFVRAVVVVADVILLYFSLVRQPIRNNQYQCDTKGPKGDFVMKYRYGFTVEKVYMQY